jgi:ParB-like chromosome segregation protein Spo0J
MHLMARQKSMNQTPNADGGRSTRLLLSQITADPQLQPRVVMDQGVLKDYADMLAADQSFDLPPVVVFHEVLAGGEEKYWLADGFHRLCACRIPHNGRYQLLREDIPIRVIEGTFRDALRYSLSANATHGLRRTNADIERAVVTALKDDEWSQWSDHEIARLCAVNQSTVSRYRAKLMQSISAAPATNGQAARTGAVRTYRTRGGKTAKMKVGNIGKRTRKPKKSPAQDEPVDNGNAKSLFSPQPGGEAAPDLGNDYPIHPAALIFPNMGEEKFEELKADIAARGQQEPVVLFRGQVLDGCQRLRACNDLGIKAKTTTYEGDDPVAHAISLNLACRALNEAQRAVCAGRAEKVLEELAKATAAPGEENGADAGDEERVAGQVEMRYLQDVLKHIEEGIAEVLAGANGDGAGRRLGESLQASRSLFGCFDWPPQIAEELGEMWADLRRVRDRAQRTLALVGEALPSARDNWIHD